ncbi:MAG: hypothetical protein JW885_03320 [Deltaproteobacteria bacterium]|nr:hypothetical protein [Candidatus Zymogenaceae bacterium]
MTRIRDTRIRPAETFLKRHVRGAAVTALILSAAIQGLDLLFQKTAREFSLIQEMLSIEGSLFLATVLAALLAVVPKSLPRALALLVSLVLLPGQMYLAVTGGMVVSWGEAVLLLAAILLLFSLIRAERG